MATPTVVRIENPANTQLVQPNNGGPQKEISFPVDLLAGQTTALVNPDTGVQHTIVVAEGGAWVDGVWVPQDDLGQSGIDDLQLSAL